MRRIRIGNKLIGNDRPCFIIAEIGSNHNQSLATAYKLCDAAKSAGADAVKFQSFTVENWISKELKSFPTFSSKKDLHKLLKECELPYSMYGKIRDYCRKKNIICFSSPSHISDVKRLIELGIPAFKFGSVQITDLPTISYAARTGKPILLSTGASSMSDIKEAVRMVKKCGNKDIIILHCTTMYPAPFERLNLNLIKTLKRAFDLPVGFSDHTLDPLVAPVEAVALGACVVEKHITLSRQMEGPDHKFALEPDEFRLMVNAIRRAQVSLGSDIKQVLPEEKEIARLGRRSIIAGADISKGTILRREMLTLKRPGTGISPALLNKVVGCVAKKDIKEDSVIKWGQLRKKRK